MCCARLISALLLLWLPVASAVAQTTHKPLMIGVFPYLSANVVIKKFLPLRDYLEKQLGQPVQLYTAPDFETFTRRMLNSEYDIAIAAPHLARLAQTRAGYRPLLKHQQRWRSIIVVSTDSTINSPAGLRGKTLATPDSLALVTMEGKQWLRQHGLQPGTDVALHQAASHNNAVYLVRSGRAAAAITEENILGQMPDALKNSVRVFARLEPMTNIIYLATSRLDKATVKRIESLLTRFGEISTSDRRFYKPTGFEGLVPVTEAEMKSMDTYAREAGQLLRLAQ